MHAVLVPVYLLLVTPITLSWWAAGSQLIKDPRVMCKARRMKIKKLDICSKPEIVEQIHNGITLGKKECQYQFRNRRWNCTTARMRKVLAKNTRETGFVNAIVAAGITFQVTRACTTGALLGCSCDRRSKNKRHKNKIKKGVAATIPAGDWQWEGCGGENIEFGIKKTKDYLHNQIRKRRSDVEILVTLHNSGAGRMAIKNHMRTECRCHGLSGSCTVRTCWHKMPPFREVGNYLRDKFDGAAKVIPGNDGHSFLPDGDTIKPPGKLDLVYYEESPDFCLPNSTLGSFGTQGRICNQTSEYEDGCPILCCNRGSKIKTVQEVTNCKCKFEWCCEVKCEKCNETRNISTCL